MQNEEDIKLCLQIFKELHEMGETVLKYVDDISEKLLEQIKNVVDVNLLQKEVKGMNSERQILIVLD